MLRGPLRLSAAAVAAGLFSVSAASAASAATGPTLNLTSDPLPPVVVDLPPAGASPGDRYAINAPVRDGSGAQVGMLRAYQTTVAIEGGGETVQTEGVFDLADGSVVFAGVARSPLEPTGLVADVRFPRAVIGGTGRYAGAGGTLVTSHPEDGAYQQRLRLILPSGTPTIMRSAGGTTNNERVDLDPPGIGPGDQIAIWGTLGGPLGGVFQGTQSVLGTDADDFLVLGSVGLITPIGDLAVVGLGTLPQTSGTVSHGRTFDRAIVGGTRAFVGRGGTQALVRGADGAFTTERRLWAPSGRVRRFTLTATNTFKTDVDLGAPGVSAGDLTVYQADVTRADGRRVGHANGTRTTVTTQDGTATADSLMTFELAGGSLVVGGIAPGPIGTAPVVRPVYGGTGAYAGVRGSVRVTPGAKPGVYRNAFRIQRIS